ncbi:MAG: hypothetical protein A3E36_02035 [Candidatus Andersenbacteria bacterium RIFCSPHIGHO2_12_FULL_45_11b]|uniref:Uncharacterized protein n=1 Tax=Candidatus Andersenbacteria bacterium RIFCSPHIGHO2_12_FULL_45_11b TaxID=1797282 RepID=A0A1G1XB31_9BACT|nr:MAG: hypothetical protein A3E36_02035 [Candidatus Andersenbacteria bacterium RIFCSPHIGHO2_12_FULL_45_11b]
MNNSIVGVWDMRHTSLTLGGLLLFLAELKVMAQLHKAKKSTICFLADTKALDGVHVLAPHDLEKVPLFSVLKDVQGIDEFLRADSMDALYKYAKKRGEKPIYWPKPTNHKEESQLYGYNSTLRLQMTFLEQGHIPLVQISPTLITWASQFLREHTSGKLPIAVHLKNNPSALGDNNANMDEWFSFLVGAQQYGNVVFILIGNESIDSRITKISNVLVTKSFNLTLSQELSLIAEASGFIGMSSGPASMAIFSRTPYVIFHNSNQRPQALVKELGESNHFSFAAPGQKFLRCSDVSSSIMKEFAWLLPIAKERYILQR